MFRYAQYSVRVPRVHQIVDLDEAADSANLLLCNAAKSLLKTLVLRPYVSFRKRSMEFDELWRGVEDSR